MSKRYSPEFKAEAVRLYRISGRSLAFGRTLRDLGTLASMGGIGAPHDNAVAQSVMATIKKKCVRRHAFKPRDSARVALFRYIEGFYSTLRRHSSIGDLSPAEFEWRLHERRLHAIASWTAGINGVGQLRREQTQQVAPDALPGV